ncbi:coiled-coil and C2 domain-containing protein 1B isoform X2 [Phascolarctos cinereus]|uniref:Coiled-coil and C2 domain-containing protein 1B n=1 Tax=Phascolarctos cinereus TaxID=38626 RepID=A0A6P5KFX9_PHACI|nr:coiled-coil and C2 domain-containing protein 1B isoform X1 [Phascolarctos cinereus]XP_020843432.1 coiled-coil and C2 domain-containing protein 1B isoform X1 [Phascolarctos cinereus]XP_020843433.1 coiled-coil and C2 domain-containing protein 1B isoform X1 [Phascolarctos cinereus]
MPGQRPRKGPQARGQGVATAKQLGLFVEFSPEDMLLEDQDGEEDDGDLEAELLALTGDTRAPESKARPKGKVPLPMAHIDKLAAECMQDVGDEASDEEDEELEADTDLLAELQEVLGEEDAGQGSPEEVAAPMQPSAPVALEVPELGAGGSPSQGVPTAGGLQGLLEERIANYQAAAAGAKEAGDGAKARRCERGLKTLQTQLTAVKKGKTITEEEIPPPVACGKRPELPPIAESEGCGELPASPGPPATSDSSTALGPSATPGPPTVPAPLEAAAPEPGCRLLLLTRQKEYKEAALKAKQEGDLERARECMRIGKRFGAVLEALDSGQPVDLSGMPPPPSELKAPQKALPAPSPGPLEHSKPVMSAPSRAPVAPPQPQTVLEALGQRLSKYQEAAAQARSSGDERKARMHERIAKQYQEAIRAHKAGRKVNLAELPVPPGFPPIPGLEPPLGPEDNPLAAALKAAQLLGGHEENEDEDEEESLPQAPVAKKPAQRPSQAPQVARPSVVPSPEPKGSTSQEALSPAAREQLALLESRRLQCQRAALQAKRAKDLEQAKVHLRAAKALDAQIALVRGSGRVGSSGTKVSSPLTDEDGGFVLIRREEVGLSQKAEEVYAQLHKMLQEQQEKCLLYSKQFMHQGNVAETTRFEKLAEDRKKQLEMLQLAQAQGLDPPSHRFEEKTFQTVRIFSELSSTEMHLVVVRGMNLPAPPGVTPDDLDAFVRFEFHYPSSDQAQKSKTSVVKNTNSPAEFDQLFKLNINRNHRGFRRLVQSKGIKFEIFHKGSFFRSDKQVGTAHLKLERLERECEIREILEVLDGRKPTGGKLEVKVRLREPLSGQDVQMVTENWLVLEPRGI